MKTHAFASAVRDAARIPDHEHAEQAGRATLQVLTDGSVERFGPQELSERVAAAQGHGCSPEHGELLDPLPGDDADLMHTENAQH